MTGHSMKQFRLAATLLVALGLGFTRILPVQASASAEFGDSSKLEKNYQFNLDDSTLVPSHSVKNKPSASFVQSGKSSTAKDISPTQNDSSTAKRSKANQSQKRPGDASGNGFFPFALVAIITLIIYNLLNRGGSTAAAEPTQASSTLATNGASDPTMLPPPAAMEEKKEPPVAVPTPALLPGLLGMGLKLMRDKKVHALTASGLEAS